MANVLVVEDDADSLEVVHRMLERAGHKVVSAANGWEGLLALDAHHVDVIVLDLMMPHLDGFTFLNTFAREEPERLRKVIVTSAASPAVIRERMDRQPFRLLPKPFDITELVTTVGDCVAAQQSTPAQA